MLYTDGQRMRVGYAVVIDAQHRGVIVACLEEGEYAPGLPADEWSCLARGVLVDTDFGGLIHYPDATHAHFVLAARSQQKTD